MHTRLPGMGLTYVLSSAELEPERLISCQDGSRDRVLRVEFSCALGVLVCATSAVFGGCTVGPEEERQVVVRCWERFLRRSWPFRMVGRPRCWLFSGSLDARHGMMLPLRRMATCFWGALVAICCASDSLGSAGAGQDRCPREDDQCLGSESGDRGHGRFSSLLSGPFGGRAVVLMSLEAVAVECSAMTKERRGSLGESVDVIWNVLVCWSPAFS